MQKKLYKFILNTLIFIVFSYFMPGIAIGHGPFGRILLGMGYGIIFTSIHSILHFFRLPNTLVVKTIVGLVLIIAYFFLISTQTIGLLTITKGYIGSTDFIIFYSPRLISLDTEVAVIVGSSIILFVCSIIVEKLKK